MESLHAILWIYARVTSRAAAVAVANWPVLGTVFAYGAVVAVAAMVAAPLGILGGFVASLAFSACVASFLYLVETMVRQRRVVLEDFPRSFGVYLWDVVGVTFVLWLFWQIVMPTIAASPQGPAIVLSIELVLLVFFNAVPELIYLGHHTPLTLLTESAAFISANWIEWFPPNLLLGAALFLLARAPAGGLLGVVRIAAIALFVYFAMVLRGFLYLELAGSTRRSRAFRYRMSR